MSPFDDNRPITPQNENASPVRFSTDLYDNQDLA